MILALRKRFNNPPGNQTKLVAKLVEGPNHKNASTLAVNGNGRHPVQNGRST